MKYDKGFHPRQRSQRTRLYKEGEIPKAGLLVESGEAGWVLFSDRSDWGVLHHENSQNGSASPKGHKEPHPEIAEDAEN